VPRVLGRGRSGSVHIGARDQPSATECPDESNSECIRGLDGTPARRRFERASSDVRASGQETHASTSENVVMLTTSGPGETAFKPFRKSAEHSSTSRQRPRLGRSGRAVFERTATKNRATPDRRRAQRTRCRLPGRRNHPWPGPAVRHRSHHRPRPPRAPRHSPPPVRRQTHRAGPHRRG
jgi:hypothetical protein